MTARKLVIMTAAALLFPQRKPPGCNHCSGETRRDGKQVLVRHDRACPVRASDGGLPERWPPLPPLLEPEPERELAAHDQTPNGRAAWRALRAEAMRLVGEGWRQKDVAAKLGITAPAVSQWLKAERARCKRT